MTPTNEVEVTGHRATVRVTAIVDTGFDGHLCLPKTTAVRLGLELAGIAEIELADGTEKMELMFAGSVQFLRESREVHVFLTDSEDSLIGTKLLEDCRLTIDFPTGAVQLVRNPRRKGGRKPK